MQAKFIFFLIVATLVVLFAAQNNAPVDIKLVTLHIKAVPASALILISMLFGTVVMGIFELISYVSLKMEITKKNSEIKKLKKLLNKDDNEQHAEEHAENTEAD